MHFWKLITRWQPEAVTSFTRVLAFQNPSTLVKLLFSVFLTTLLNKMSIFGLSDTVYLIYFLKRKNNRFAYPDIYFCLNFVLYKYIDYCQEFFPQHLLIFSFWFLWITLSFYSTFLIRLHTPSHLLFCALLLNILVASLNDTFFK